VAGADHTDSGVWPAYEGFDLAAGMRALLDKLRGVNDGLERLDELESDRPPALDGTEDTMESH
jgi:hypothetical protein